MSADEVREEEEKWWAARVAVPVLEDGEAVGAETQLVIVHAKDAEDARRESGIVDASFEEATQEELVEWDDLTTPPLNEEELGRLLTLVRRELVAIANKEARERGFGAKAQYRSLNRYKAASLVRVKGKLELLAGE